MYNDADNEEESIDEAELVEEESDEQMPEVVVGDTSPKSDLSSDYLKKRKFKKKPKRDL